MSDSRGIRSRVRRLNKDPSRFETRENVKIFKSFSPGKSGKNTKKPSTREAAAIATR